MEKPWRMIVWKAMGDVKMTPRFQTLLIAGRLMVPLTKRRSLFSTEKNETKEVNTHGTFILGHLPVKKFTAVVTSEKLSSFM